ncbi:hypothetical protein FVEG_10839 [Fusarium verticillioides 7600]|uniref:Amino acid permease/ SLC12A domain-containing protein n=1 Tax=Gibberella moniliformis (strain M3125 / FGSC 7600) TaxID=334819 RepID=W7MWF2_GIBM7|nr:hypothetical protein FVEG_10839 [Fusarium verticillioides 7600]EWG52005.1 hypothetical protein FVEG_10839 [Fusarium verticillioides 7600]
MPRAFKTIIHRLRIFFIGGCLCVGMLTTMSILQAVQTHTVVPLHSNVISMGRLQIPVLPSIVTPVSITAIVSAGNAYTFNASRNLHALALEGQAPKGVPYLAVVVVMTLACLALLALGLTSAKVLNCILNFCTAATMLCAAKLDCHGNHMDPIERCDEGTRISIGRHFYLPGLGFSHTPVIGRFAAPLSFCRFKDMPSSSEATGARQLLSSITALSLLRVALASGGSCSRRLGFHGASEVDLVSHLYFFDVLTEHYRHEREVAPQNLKDKILAKIF